ncbi:Type II restriction modification system endonuclease [Mycoplasmopsis bovigenitalium 51080]|uniref:Type II restriction modification system endonuclease n=1 Tax=Mycoplasmopsis bovigenitalium 51080 TaxID=1188235 RepID=N9VFS3_9BACT|nr:type II restriction endonuclease [Mycoplasmopsis bovigenitalium]ENY70201.1 Type II restriction modification system endonuclease [Mycoplasmopsis bovigenitalium 51080]
MVNISLDEYKNLVKEKRKNSFKQPYDLVYDNFIKLGYDKVSKEFFLNNASEVVEKLRDSCWNEFKPLEKEFTSKMLRELVDDNYIRNLTPIDAITWFVEEFPEHIYALTLSNTQSRRSRAGKEFESIIELILIGAGIPLDSQGNIGKQVFVSKGIGKLVDLVSPGVLEYILNKRNTVLISAKTTLRERWQEVPEEMGRTGAREMFLATLDDSISSDVLNTLYEANIQVTTTKNIKEKYYTNNGRVLTFEKLVEICLDNISHWENFNRSVEQNEQIIELINKQIEKHHNHKFVEEYYNERLKNVKEKENQNI